MDEKVLEATKGAICKESLAADIKSWAGIDVQILHRFTFDPYVDEEKMSLCIIVWDNYQMTHLQTRYGDLRHFINSREALQYLRSCYKDKDEEYEIIVKKKKRGDGDGDSGTEV